MPPFSVLAGVTLSVTLAASPLALVPHAAAAPSAAPSSSTPSSGWRHDPAAVQPVLRAHAQLSADHLEDGPPSGAAATPANGRTGPFPGQVVPGFSAMVANRDGTFWAMPDNGFGAKSNSGDFLLRIYLVRPDWETASGGSGEIEVVRHIDLADPDRVAGFPIVNEGSRERLLTGSDFDIESLVRSPDGSFWIGDEFGPFLLHFGADGTLLEKPVPFPGGKSPSNPFLGSEAPNVGSSRGFEAMAATPDGTTLYPVVEGRLNDDPQARRRWVYEFDVTSRSYTGRRWAFQTDRDADVVGDAFWAGPDRLLLIERDDFDGPSSVIKRVYEVDLRRRDGEGYLQKTLVLDALRVANPDGIDSGTGYGTGDPWSLPVQSFETVVGVGPDTLLVANDNNYPGNSARNPGTPDDTEMALIQLRRPKPGPAASSRGRIDGPVLVGHRGASGYRPEHTLASYETAIVQCADFIEPDVVSTKDGVLVARHENEISGTTDVASHPEFAARRTTKTVDGVGLTGWFTEDFTLAELRTLRAKERLPQTRPANTAFDGKYEIPTLDEVMDLARHSRTCDGHPVGVYPETKHPTYFDSVGLSLEEPLVRELRRNGLDRPGAPVFVQSFEPGNLRQLDRMTKAPLVFLVDCQGAPYDLVAAGDRRTYADLVTPASLRQLSGFLDGIGACKGVLVPRDADNHLTSPTPVTSDAHRAGLFVHAWTFRAENTFLPAEYRSSADPNAYGDLAGEIREFLAAGIDGLFSDQPDLAHAAVDGAS